MLVERKIEESGGVREEREGESDSWLVVQVTLKVSLDLPDLKC